MPGQRAGRKKEAALPELQTEHVLTISALSNVSMLPNTFGKLVSISGKKVLRLKNDLSTESSYYFQRDLFSCGQKSNTWGTEQLKGGQVQFKVRFY